VGECGRAPASLGTVRGLRTVWVCKACLQNAVTNAYPGNTTCQGISISGAKEALRTWPAPERDTAESVGNWQDDGDLADEMHPGHPSNYGDQ